MDIRLPGKSGIECIRRLKPLLPATQFVMVTVYEDANHIFNALAAGASYPAVTLTVNVSSGSGTSSFTIGNPDLQRTHREHLSPERLGVTLWKKIHQGRQAEYTGAVERRREKETAPIPALRQQRGPEEMEFEGDRRLRFDKLLYFFFPRRQRLQLPHTFSPTRSPACRLVPDDGVAPADVLHDPCQELIPEPWRREPAGQVDLNLRVAAALHADEPM